MAKVPCLSLPLGGPDRLTDLPQDLLAKIVVLIQSGRELLALSQASKDLKGAPWGGRWHDKNLKDPPNGGLDWRALIKCDDSAECNSEEVVEAVLDLETHDSFLESVEDICKKRPSIITIDESCRSFAFQNDLPWGRLISNEAMQALFKCVTLLKLKEASRIDFLSFAIRSNSLGKLRELSLDGNVIGDAGVFALAGAIGSLSSLTHLDLDANNISDDGMAALAGAIGSMGNLKHLYIQDNQVGDAGMIKFSEAIANGSLPNLEKLLLGSNKIGDAGMAAFACAIASGSLRALEELYLNQNQIGDDGMSALAGAIASGSLPALKALGLHSNQIGDAGMTELSRAIASGSLGKLELLYLSYNEIGDAGLTELSRAIVSGSLRHLKKLSLWNNQIGDVGREAQRKITLAKGGLLPNLTHLFLDR